MDIRAYLRDLDREEEELRREIMRLQVRIAQLHDTRLLMMHREEERARRLDQPSPFGAIPGGEIAVRDPALTPLLAASEAGQLSKAAKTGSRSLPPLNHKGNETLTRRALAILAEATEPMTAGQVADRMPDVVRRRLHNACNNLRVRGSLVWDRDHRYSITEAGRRELGSETHRTFTPRAPRSEQGKAGPLLLAAFMAAPDGVLSPSEACAAVYGNRANRPGKTSKQERDIVYAHLHKLKNAGRLVRLDDGRYRWAGRQEAAA